MYWPVVPYGFYPYLPETRKTCRGMPVKFFRAGLLRRTDQVAAGCFEKFEKNHHIPAFHMLCHLLYWKAVIVPWTNYIRSPSVS